MTLLRFNPVKAMDELSKKVNDFAGDFENGFTFESGYNPRVDITEDDKSIFVNMELPGIAKENVKISINEDRLLTVKGEKKFAEKDEKTNYIRRERDFGAFARSFVMPEGVDVENVGASFENGVLEIKLDKKEPEKPKEINVEIA